MGEMSYCCRSLRDSARVCSTPRPTADGVTDTYRNRMYDDGHPHLDSWLFNCVLSQRRADGHDCHYGGVKGVVYGRLAHPLVDDWRRRRWSLSIGALRKAALYLREASAARNPLGQGGFSWPVQATSSRAKLAADAVFRRDETLSFAVILPMSSATA